MTSSDAINANTITVSPATFRCTTLRPARVCRRSRGSAVAARKRKRPHQRQLRRRRSHARNATAGSTSTLAAITSPVSSLCLLILFNLLTTSQVKSAVMNSAGSASQIMLDQRGFAKRATEYTRHPASTTRLDYQATWCRVTGPHSKAAYSSVNIVES